MDFLYYSSSRNVDLPALGLAGVLGGIPVQTREVLSGPDGKAGMIITARTDDHAGYYADHQTWEAVPCRPGLWIGYETACPPTPDELRRAETVRGHEVLLGGAGPGGERYWTIPLARIFPTGSMLPQTLRLGPDGKVCKQVLPRFIEVCQKADRAFAWLRSVNGYLAPGEEPSFPIGDDEAFAMAADVLGVNYRVGPAEVSALGLLTSDTITERVLAPFVDFYNFMSAQADRIEASKKNDPAITSTGDDTDCGLPGECPVTS